MKITKNIIEGEGLQISVEQGKTTERSRLFFDKVEYINNHLMFYQGDKLIFKMWLEEKYNSITEALNSLKMEII